MSSVVPSCVVCVGVVCGIILLDCAYFFVDSYVVCGIILCNLCLHFCVVCSFYCAVCCICFYFLRHPLRQLFFLYRLLRYVRFFFLFYTIFLYGSSFTWCPYSLCNVSAGVYIFLSQSAEKNPTLTYTKNEGKKSVFITSIYPSRRTDDHAIAVSDDNTFLFILLFLRLFFTSPYVFVYAGTPYLYRC